MSVQDLKDKVRMAEQSVSEIEDPILKAKAFEVVLQNLLTHKTEDSGTKLSMQTDLTQTPVDTSLFDPSRVSAGLNIELTDLQNVIEFSGDKFHIIATIPGSTEGDRQRNACLIYLTITNYFNNSKSSSATDLKKILQNHGIGSLVNLATNLTIDANKRYIVKEGNPGSKDTMYSITIPGIQRGAELIRSMIPNNTA